MDVTRLEQMLMKRWFSIILLFPLILISLTAFGENKKASRPMKSKSGCSKHALARTECMISAILENIRTTYSNVGGGGITEIKSLATNTYRVAISQEEKIDHITYEFEEMGDGQLRISKRTESAEPMGR